MATNSPDPEAEASSDKEHHKGEQSPSEGCSRFSRRLCDSSYEEFLRYKAEKRTKRDQPIQPKRTGLSSRKRINPVSKKGKKKRQEYAKATKEHYQNDENRRCALCGTQRNLSIHHVKKRLEGNHAEKESFITLCLIGDFLDKRFPESNHSHSGGCHGWIEGNKTWARENGYLV